jgi:RNA polymerase sigma-70 factor, ECF subfamily
VLALVPPLRSDDARPDGQPADQFSQLVHAHAGALQATALRLCRNHADARDLVQDALERALRNYHRYQAGTSCRSWLLTILHHLFIDRCRRNGRDRRADPGTLELIGVPAQEHAEEEPVWAKITPEDLRAALQKIPEEFRRVYELHALEGKSYNEIALMLALPKATVGTRLIRARRKLKKILMPEAEEEESP